MAVDSDIGELKGRVWAIETRLDRMDASQNSRHAQVMVAIGSLKDSRAETRGKISALSTIGASVLAMISALGGILAGRFWPPH